MAIVMRVSSPNGVTRAQAELIRRLSRLPLDQAVVQRRLLIRALRRKGLSRQDVADYLELRHDQVVTEETAGGQAQAQLAGRAGRD